MTLAVSLTLLRPLWLLVLLAVPLFAWLTIRAARGRPRAGDYAALAARTILLAVIALALSVPRAETESKGRAVAYVLDVSESIPPDALHRAGEFIKDSASRRAEDDDASFVVFADGASVEAPFARVSSTRRMEAVVIDPANLASRLPSSESDVEGALRIARAGFPPGGSRRVVLVTDGNETRGDAAAAVKELTADKVDVQVVPVRYEREREVLVEKIVAPAVAGTVAPVPLRVVVASTHAAVDARVRVLVDDREVKAEDVKLEKGQNYFEVAYRFENSGFHRIEAVVEPTVDGDPANNRGSAGVVVEGRGRVLVASTVAQSPLAQALRENMDADIDAGGPELLPADPGGLVPYDAVVLENVPAFALGDAQRRLLASAVRDLGVGLVCIGGPQTYGPGGYAGTDLEEVLPVTSDVSQKRILPAGALVVVLHTCEFPDGNRAAREITKAAINALSAQDEIGVLDYDMRGGDRWVVDLQRPTDKAALCKAVDNANPADMPSFASIVEMALGGLEKSTAAVKHMIIISDGDPAPPDGKLQARITGAKISISTVLVNPHSRQQFEPVMQRLAEANGGRYYFVDARNIDRLPQIFMKEAVTVRRSAVSETPFKPSMGALHRMLRDIAETDLPPLHGYVITTARDRIEQVLSGPDGDPILASWRAGLGQSAAFTSDASAWAREWAAWGGYGRFFSQVVKSSLRALTRTGARASADVSGGTAHVTLDALSPTGDFANGLEVTGRVLSPDGTTAEFRVEQTGPGRYEGSFPAEAVGTSLATIVYRNPADPDAAPGQAVVPVCLSYSAEHLAQRSNERFFATLEAAGATILDVDRLDDALAKDPKAVNARALPWQGAVGAATESLEMWPWLAAAAALLLVADVAVRRVRIPWDRLLRRAKPVASGAVAAAGPAKPPAAAAYVAKSAAPDAPPSETPRETPRSAAPSPPAAPSAPQDGLLGAKRRAQKKQKWEENQ